MNAGTTKLACRTSTTWRSASLELAGQGGEKGGKIVGLEFLPRVELPEDRPKLGFELRYAAREEALDRIAGLGEDAAMGGVARPLSENTKSSGVSPAHLRKLSGFCVL